MKSKHLQPAFTVSIAFAPLLYSCIACLVLVLLTALFYAPSLKYGFYFDDRAQILNYFKIRTNTFRDLFFVGPRWIAYWINSLIYWLFKHDSLPYRLFNLVVHSATGITIFTFLATGLNNLKGDQHFFYRKNAFMLAFLTAGLFLLHPVQTQTVTYIVQGQLEGLAGFFIMAQAFCFMLAYTTKNWLARRCLLYLLFILAFFSCGTKEIAIIGPLLLVTVDWFFVAQGNLQEIKQRWWIHGLLFCLVGSVYLYVLKPVFFKKFISLNLATHNNPGNLLITQGQASINSWLYLCSQFKVIVHYIWIFLCPINLSVDYDWKLVSSFFSFDSLAPFSILLLSAVTFLRQWRKNPAGMPFFALCWFCIAIAPRSSIIPSPELLADYKTYIASLGILFLLTIIFIKLITHFIKNFSMQLITIFLLVTASGICTYQRNKVWQSALDFWHHIVTQSPDKARSHNNYAIALSQAGRHQEAIAALNKAIELDNNYANPYINLSIAYSSLGDIDKEIECLAKAVALDPTLYELYNNLATAFISKKNYVEAEKAFAYALAINPRYGKALYNKGMMYMQQNNPVQAWLAFKQCCTEADFDNELGFTAFAKVSMQLDKHDAAYFACKNLLAINSNNSYALNVLGRIGKR